MAEKKIGFLRKTFDPRKSAGSSLLRRGNALFNDATAAIMALGMLPMKDGGRVRGCGIAKRGFGKAMKRKKK
tara:strand:+ start:154 stop:369 length:216 start_codon:yes stop_codon:yes gene_type:complete